MKETYSYSLTEEKNCCCGDMSGEDCCTSDKIEVKKVEDNYIVSEFHFITKQIGIVAFDYPVFINTVTNSFTSKVYTNQKLIPPKLIGSLSILYRSILI